MISTPFLKDLVCIEATRLKGKSDIHEAKCGNSKHEANHGGEQKTISDRHFQVKTKCGSPVLIGVV